MWNCIEGAVIRIPAIPDAFWYQQYAACEHTRARTVIKLLSCVKETQKGLYKSSLPSVELAYMMQNCAQKLPKSI